MFGCNIKLAYNEIRDIAMEYVFVISKCHSKWNKSYQNVFVFNK